MPLSPQEDRCVSLACRHLAQRVGGAWELGSSTTLAETHPNVPSPEVIVYSGQRSAAVEVKRLTGDSEWNNYRTYFQSLQRSLAPPSGGHWILSPSLDFRLPMDPPTRRRVKRQIEELSSWMRPDGIAAVRFPRRALISLVMEYGPGYIYCCHTSTGSELLRRASASVSGNYMLVDCDQWEHSFVTAEAEDAFVEALAAVCERCVRDGEAMVDWMEEWKIIRGEDGDGQVDLIVVTNAREVWSSNAEAVDLVLDSALQKFRACRWADYHVIVLDLEGIMLKTELILEVIRGYDDDSLRVADLILVADGDELTEGYCTPSIR